MILLWLDGGPGHMDMYDMKPEAPAEYRGIWNPIRTNVPGFEITELFPRQAKIADKFSIVRSLHHDTGDHFTGGHYMLTSRGGASGAEHRRQVPRRSARSPPRCCGPRQPGMPAYVAVPYATSIGLRPGYFGANYLGLAHNPFETDGDPNSPNFQVENIQLANALTVDRLEDRHGLLQALRPPAARRRHLGHDGDDGPLRAQRLRDGGRRQRPQGVRPELAKTPSCATATAARPGARARCWPGGWSRPAPPSSPSTSAAGTITGT